MHLLQQVQPQFHNDCHPGSFSCCRAALSCLPPISSVQAELSPYFVSCLMDIQGTAQRNVCTLGYLAKL